MLDVEGRKHLRYKLATLWGATSLPCYAGYALGSGGGSRATFANILIPQPSPMLRWLHFGKRPCYAGYTLSKAIGSRATLATISATEAALVLRWLYFGQRQRLPCYAGYTLGNANGSRATLATL